MNTHATRAIAVLIIMLSIFATIPFSLAQNYTVSYQLLDQQGENAAYTLNIVVSENLLQYYQDKNHQLNTLTDFTRFVTPYAIKPVADCLKQIYQNEEDFVNGALMIVHQMNYVETKSGKYPAETFVNNKGDCDVFSYVAASIIVAGGIDVVLLDYEEKNHMNIGVNLANPPTEARQEVYKIAHDNVDYYIAECTGGNWTRGWKVGECPDNMKQAAATVLTLENAEEFAPGQVSASFKTLESSKLSLEIWPPIAVEESTVTFRGSLSPTKPNQNVTIYMGVSGHPWTILSTVLTKPDGSFEYTWKTTTSGIYAVRASWAGDKTYAGSTTETMSTTIIPLILTALIAVAIISIIIGAIAVVAARHTRQDSLSIREPEPPGFRTSN